MKKHTLFALLGAGTLALSASVGFAAWTIKNNTDKKTDSLQLSADATINNENVTLNEGTKWTDSTVQFKPVKSKANYSWLDASEELPEEDLSASYAISGTAGKNQALTISATFEDITTTSDDVKSYADLTALGDNKDKTDHGIVGTLPTPKISHGSTGNIQDSSLSITADAEGNFSATITVTFSWGAAFGGKNPYAYYNFYEYSKPLADLAQTNIGYLSYLPKCSFKLAVTVTASN